MVLRSLLSEALSDATPITITIGALATLASAVGGYATLRARVTQLEQEKAELARDLAAVRADLHDLLLWRERTRVRLDRAAPARGAVTVSPGEYSLTTGPHHRGRP